MPWKLIFFTIILVCITIFIGFNLENTCNVWLFYTSFENVPIFISTIIAFALGVFVMIPFVLLKNRSSDEKQKVEKQKAEKKQKKHSVVAASPVFQNEDPVPATNTVKEETTSQEKTE